MVAPVLVGAQVLWALPAASTAQIAPSAEVPAASVNCGAPVDSDAAAYDLAAACGRPVEIPSGATPFSRVLAEPDGTLTLESSVAATRTRIRGQWEPVDPSIVPDGAGGLTVAAPVFDIDLAGGAAAGEPFVTLTDVDDQGAAGVALSTPVALGAPQIDPQNPARAMYPVLDDVGTPVQGAVLAVTVDPDGTGVTPVLRLDSPESAAVVQELAGASGLGFTVESSGDLDLVVSEVARSAGGEESGAPGSGEFAAVEPGGRVVFVGTQASQWDSAAGNGAGEGAGLTGFEDGGGSAVVDSSTQSQEPPSDTGDGDQARADRFSAPQPGDVVTTMKVTQAADGAVLISANDEMLTDPQTTFPVFVDPEVSGTLAQWTAVKSGWPDSYSGYKFQDNANGDQGVGLCPMDVPNGCTRTNVQRLMYEFNLSDLPSGVAGGDVIAGTFSAYGTHSYDCTPRPIDLYVLGGNQVTSTTTWNSKGQWVDSNFVTSVSTAHKPSMCPDYPRARIAWDATSALKRVANNDWTFPTFGLRAANESAVEAWKRYAGQEFLGTSHPAQLSVRFNREPNAPSGMATVVDGTSLGCSPSTSPEMIRTLTPTMRVTASDPDGVSPFNQEVKVYFRVIDTASGSTVWSADTIFRSSGSTHTMPIPSGELSSQRTYKWQTMVRDRGDLESAWTTGCYFRPDVTAPAAPAVSSTAFPTDQVVAPSTTGTFAMSANGSSDVVAYQFAFNSTAYGAWKSPASTGGSVSTTMPSPLAPGRNRLLVRSKDAAGNQSPVTEYVFYVTFSVADQHWKLNEGTGTTSANTVSGGSPLGMSGGVTWTSGFFDYKDGNAADRGWKFDDDSDGAPDVGRASGVDVALDKPFTVMAFLKVDQLPAGSGAAVSQEGAQRSSFHLGYSKTSACVVDPSPCWAFWVVNADTVGAPNTIVRSNVPVVPGQWVHVTGIHDPVNDTIKLYVCPWVSPDYPAQQHGPFQTTGFVPAWTTTGDLRLGSGMSAGNPQWPYYGSADEVRVYDHVVDASKARRACDGAATP